MLSTYVGIDVAKNHLDVAVWLARGGQSLARQTNTPQGFAGLATALAAVISSDQQIHLVLEPTGGYELALVNFALEQGWQVSLPNPKQVRDWAKGQGRRAKTDRQDALMLAQYGATQQPAPQVALPENLRQLELLLARQLDLQQMLRQERNRQHSLAYRPNVAEPVHSSVDRLID
jgi:transposase